ncbi:hypothetical protein R3P38DRAFT_183663 [Favolaschia claudopus]|uniref:Uncharacterized protein n=1 Tax=Favolaschia claudopus TaxID=2862362 RepID=A0AAW0D0L5_9AGAR
MYKGYKDGYVFPLEPGQSAPEWLCRCEAKCNGEKKVSRRTWFYHHPQADSRPAIRAVPVHLTTATGSSTTKQARPRSDSDEVAATAPQYIEPMEVDVDSEDRAGEFSPVLPSLAENLFEATDTFTNLDELELLSDDEGLNMDPLPQVDYWHPDLEDASKSDSEQEPYFESEKDLDSNMDLGAASNTGTESLSTTQEQPSSNPSLVLPTLGSSTTAHLPAGVNYTPRPPWRSIAKEDVKIEKLRNSLDFIEKLEGACKANSQMSPEDNERLWNSPQMQLDTSDPAMRQAIKTFIGADTPITIETFNAVRDAAIERHPNDFFPSFYQTQKTLAECLHWSFCRSR